MNSITKVTGENIKIARIRRGLTQTVLAKTIPMDQAYLSRIERGVQEPSLEMLGKIAKALGCDSSDLMREGEKKSNKMETTSLSQMQGVDATQPSKGMSWWGGVVDEAQKAAAREDVKELALIKSLLDMASETIMKAQNKSKQGASQASVVVTNNGHHNKNTNSINVRTTAL